MIRWGKMSMLPLRLQKVANNLRRASSSEINLENLEKESLDSTALTEDTQAKIQDEKIERSRNKSGLYDQHWKILHELNPYPEPQMWHHGTVKFLRKSYGTYGTASGVNPSICWPLKEELVDKKDYEKIAFPHTIMEMIEEAKQKRSEKEDREMLRQKDIVQKMKKLQQWKQDLYIRIQKKENEIKVAKERRERLVEEVRRHFGYSVDPRDDKFKEMLEKKEKEQKKAAKEARRKAKDEDSKKKKNSDVQKDERGTESIVESLKE